jgi:hypothetical protein
MAIILVTQYKWFQTENKLPTPWTEVAGAGYMIFATGLTVGFVNLACG